MESKRFFQNMKEILFSDVMIYVTAIAVSLLALLAFLIFGTVRTDLTCTRALDSLVECTLVRNSLLQKMAPIKIHQPLAVDVIEHSGKRRSYSAEIRAANIGYTLPLLTSDRSEIAQDVADEVNFFLHESKATSFTETFPKKRVKTNAQIS